MNSRSTALETSWLISRSTSSDLLLTTSWVWPHGQYIIYSILRLLSINLQSKGNTSSMMPLLFEMSSYDMSMPVSLAVCSFMASSNRVDRWRTHTSWEDNCSKSKSKLLSLDLVAAPWWDYALPSYTCYIPLPFHALLSCLFCFCLAVVTSLVVVDTFAVKVKCTGV